MIKPERHEASRAVAAPHWLEEMDAALRAMRRVKAVWKPLRRSVELLRLLLRC